MKERYRETTEPSNQAIGMAGNTKDPNEIDYLRQENEKLRGELRELQIELLGLFRRVHGQERPSY